VTEELHVQLAEKRFSATTRIEIFQPAWNGALKMTSVDTKDILQFVQPQYIFGFPLNAAVAEKNQYGNGL